MRRCLLGWRACKWFPFLFSFFLFLVVASTLFPPFSLIFLAFFCPFKKSMLPWLTLTDSVFK